MGRKEQRVTSVDAKGFIERISLNNLLTRVNIARVCLVDTAIVTRTLH